MKQRNGQPHMILKEAAHYLDVPIAQMVDFLFEGGGPIHEFRGDDVLYRPADLDYFRLARRCV